MDKNNPPHGLAAVYFITTMAFRYASYFPAPSWGYVKLLYRSPKSEEVYKFLIPIHAPEMTFSSPEGKAASYSTPSVALVFIDQIEEKLNFSFHFIAAAFSCFILL